MSKHLPTLLVIILLLSGIRSFAQTTSWIGTTSTSWSTSTNWTAGVPSATKDVVIGDGNYAGPHLPVISVAATSKSITISAPLTLTVNKTLSVAGNIVVNTGAGMGIGKASISLGGNWINNGSVSTSSNIASVIFNGLAQSIGGSSVTSFRRLTVNTGSTVTLLANVSVTGSGSVCDVKGTINPSESPTFKLTTPLLNVFDNAVLKVKGATFADNYAVSGTATLSDGSIVEYAATTANQSVSAAFSYSTLIISGTGIKSLGAALPALRSANSTVGNIFVNSGTLDLGAFAANRGISVPGGTLLVANGASLKVGGSSSFPVNFQTVTLNLTSTVEYNGPNQMVAARGYGNLALTSGSGAAVKNMAATPFTVTGNFITATGSGTSVVFTASEALSIDGDVRIGAGTTVNGGNFTHDVSGNWINSGTYNGGTGAIRMRGPTTSVGGTGIHNFNDLLLASNVTADASSSIGISGNLSTINPGTFHHLPGGTLTMSGASKSISGANIVLGNVTVNGSVTTSSLIEITGNVTVGGSFSATAGVVTLSGISKALSGTGTVVFNTLFIKGSTIVSSNFRIDASLNIAGSFSATSGTATFTSVSSLNGIANLFNVSLNGTSLQLSSNAVLGVAGALTIASGMLDVTTNLPNTVRFNGAGPQTVNAISYNTLSLSNGSTKTAAGNISVISTINIGSGTTFNGGSFIHSVSGNWVNNGTFTAATGTVQFTGNANASISGTTIFNNLTINKSAVSNVITLTGNTGATNVNMTSGVVRTGTFTLTVTGTRTGNGIILGTITRTHLFTTGVTYAFEGPDNTIRFSSVSGITSVTVNTTLSPVTDFSNGSTLNRFYTISVGAGSYTASLSLHYDDGELNGIDETSMALYRHDGSAWALSGKTSNSTSQNFVVNSSITGLSGRWTLSEFANIARWTGAVNGAWENAGNWSVVQGTAGMPPSQNDIVEIGTAPFSNQPSVSSAVTVKSLLLGSAQPVTLSLAAGGSFVSNGNINGIWTADAMHTINTGAQNLTVKADLPLSTGLVGRGVNVNIGSGTVTILGSATIAGNAALSFTGGGRLVIGEDLVYAGGTVNTGTGTIQFSGDGAQSIPGLTYNHLVVDKTSGIASINTGATVAGSLTVSAGELDLDAATSVLGDVNIAPGGALHGDSVTLQVGGNWNNSGTFVPGSGTVILNGTLIQTIKGTFFNNLSISKSSGSADLAANITIGDNLSIVSGTVNLFEYTANRTGSGGQLTLDNGAVLTVGGSGNFPSNFSSYQLATNSLVHYNGAMAQAVKGVSYGALTVSNGSANPKTFSADLAVTGDLTIASGATLAAETYSISLFGNWINGGTFMPGSVGSLVLNGTDKSISGNNSFNRVVVNGSYTVAGSDIEYNGLFAVTQGASYFAGTGIATVKGDLTNAGTLFSNGTTTFVGTGPQTLRLMNAISSTSTGVVNFNGSISPVLNSTSSPLFATLHINNTAGIFPSTPWTVLVSFNVKSTSGFHGGVHNHNFYGAFVNNGIVTSDGTLNISPAFPAPVKLSGGSFTSKGVVVFGGAGNATISGTPAALHDVIIASTNSSGVTPASGWTMSGKFSINSNARFNGSSFTHTVGDNLESDGILDGGSSTFLMTAPAGALYGSPATSFHHFTIAPGARITANSDFNVAGNFKNDGVIDGTLGVLTMTGAENASITSSNSGFELSQVTINKSSAATVSAAVNLSSLNSLSVVNGTFFTSTYSLSEDPTGGMLTVEAGAKLKIGGINTIPAFTSIWLDPLSTVEYAGGIQTIANTPNYGNLLLSSPGSKVAQLPLSIATDLQITNGDFNSNAVSVLHSVGGNFSMTGGTFDDNKISLRFNGNNGDQLVSSIAPVFNLVVNKFVGLVALSSHLTVNNQLTLTNGRVQLGTYDLRLTSAGIAVTGATATRYIIASGAGRLVQQVAGGATRTFPVGTSTEYMPATIAFTAGSVADNIGLRLRDAAFEQGEAGAQETQDAVRGTWIFSEGVAGGSNATVSLQWPASLEMTGFNRAFSRLAQFETLWQYGNADIAATGANPYSVSRSGITSLSTFAVAMLGALPVTWLTVSGNHTAGNNHIQWSTVNEDNNKLFYVEGSPDARNFVVLGTLPGGGTTHTVQQYRFTDFGVKAPVTYYRIRQEDLDGKISYSPVIRIDAKGIQGFSVGVWPNPVSDHAAATITTGKATAVQLQLLDATGRSLSALSLRLVAGTNTVPLNMAGAKAGIYFLRITDDTGGARVIPLLKR